MSLSLVMDIPDARHGWPSAPALISLRSASLMLGSLLGLVRPLAPPKVRGSVETSVLVSLWGLALYAYPHGVLVEAELQLLSRLKCACRGLDLASALDDAEASP